MKHKVSFLSFDLDSQECAGAVAIDIHQRSMVEVEADNSALCDLDQLHQCGDTSNGQSEMSNVIARHRFFSIFCFPAPPTAAALKCHPDTPTNSFSSNTDRTLHQLYVSRVTQPFIPSLNADYSPSYSSCIVISAPCKPEPPTSVFCAHRHLNSSQAASSPQEPQY